MSDDNIRAVTDYLRTLQMRICSSLEDTDGVGKFERDHWDRADGGGGESRVLTNGKIFEQAGVSFSHVFGDQMPPSATQSRPELAGKRFQAMGVSLVLHPHNPYVPTTHANFRFFTTEGDDADAIWWFGGGFDLTPYYPFLDDVIHWHRSAKAACDSFGEDYYPSFKQWCDKYFYLPHRNETRGVGGLFFDDLNKPDFDSSFALTRAIGDQFLPAYLPIVKARHEHKFG